MLCLTCPSFSPFSERLRRQLQQVWHSSVLLHWYVAQHQWGRVAPSILLITEPHCNAISLSRPKREWVLYAGGQVHAPAILRGSGAAEIGRRSGAWLAPYYDAILACLTVCLFLHRQMGMTSEVLTNYGFISRLWSVMVVVYSRGRNSDTKTSVNPRRHLIFHSRPLAVAQVGPLRRRLWRSLRVPALREPQRPLLLPGGLDQLHGSCKEAVPADADGDGARCRPQRRGRDWRWRYIYIPLWDVCWPAARLSHISHVFPVPAFLASQTTLCGTPITLPRVLR